MASFLAKLQTVDPSAVSAATALEMATIGGARALGIDRQIGSLEPRKRADLIVVSMRAARQTPIYDPVSHLVYVTRGDDVRDTIVNGRVLMRDRKVLTPRRRRRAEGRAGDGGEGSRGGEVADAHACVPALALAVAAPAAALPVRAAGPDLQTVLDLATAYELKFIGQFENVVAEEVYVQEMSSPRRKRTIKSDFLLRQVSGRRGVDDVARRVRGGRQAGARAAQADRMMKLFTSPVPNAVGRARALAEEGARYNLLDIGTLNNPVLAMVFLQPDYRPRFRFNLAGIEKSSGRRSGPSASRSSSIPTILRTGANQDLLSRGLLWVDEQTGRVVKTRLQVGPWRIPPEIVTTFRHEPELGIDVPAEMRDWYPDGNRGDINGVATYGRFRRFQVTHRRVDSEVGATFRWPRAG